MDNTPQLDQPEPPTGTFQGRVGVTGRVKLPVAIYRYLIRLGQERVFLTSLDRKTVRVYPLSEWRKNQRIFGDFKEDAQAAEDVAFLADDMGRDSEIDDQGRIMIPAELRRELGLENQPIWMNCYRGHVSIFSQSVYEERKRRATENLEEKLRKLEEAGLR